MERDEYRTQSAVTGYVARDAQHPSFAHEAVAPFSDEFVSDDFVSVLEDQAGHRSTIGCVRGWASSSCTSVSTSSPYTSEAEG